MTVVRWIITGKLKTGTPLAIHSGEGWKDKTIQDGIVGQAYAPGLEDVDRLVVRDARGLPYIPGSSLKGALLGYAERWHDIDDSRHDACIKVFGRGGDSESMRGGCAVFESALDCTTQLPDGRHLPWWNAERHTYVEAHTAIDRRTGSVAEGKLYCEEAVPPGIEFALRIILDTSDRRLVTYVLQLLAGFELPIEKEPVSLGSNSTFEWGRVALPEVEVKALQPTSANMPIDPFTANDIETALKTGAKVSPPPRHVRIRLTLQLDIEGAFLVCAPAGSLTSLDVPGEPDHIPRLAEVPPSLDSLVTPHQRIAKGRALLPASSVKGAVRAHLERMLRTDWASVEVSPWELDGDTTEATPKFIQALLGSTERQSLLIASDFKSTKEDSLRVRELVSIDRWAGSVAGSAKFNLLAFEQPSLVGSLVLMLPGKSFSQGERLAAIGLLALLVRDLIDGQVQFGYGDTKGFGHGTCQLVDMGIGDRNKEGEDLLKLVDLPPQLLAFQATLLQSFRALGAETQDRAMNIALKKLDEFLQVAVAGEAT